MSGGPGPDATAPPRGARAVTFLLAASFLVHLGLVAAFTQARHLREPKAFVYGDYSLHFFDALQARESVRQTGALWAWSPRFLAGYPAQVFDAVSNRPAEILLALLPWPAPEVLFKLWVTATLVLAPLVVLAAARLAGLPRPAPAIAALLAIAHLHLDARLFTFLRRGLFQFPFACTVAVLATAALAALARRTTPGRTLAAGALLGVALLCHPTTALLLVPPAAVLLALERRRAFAIALAGAALLALLPNLPWIVAGFRNLGFLGPDSGFWSTHEQSLARDLLANPGAALASALAVVALAAPLAGERRARLPWAAAVAAALLLGYAGSAFPLVRRLEPARFALAAATFALLPAAAVAARALARGARRARAVVALGALTALVPLALGPRSDPLPNFLRFTLPIDEVPEADLLARTLERVTDKSGRVLLDQDWPGAHTHGFIAAYLAQRVDREWLGGPHPWVKVAQNGANPLLGWFLGRRLADQDDAELDRLLALYAARWVVTRTGDLVARLERSAAVRPVAVAGSWHVYRATHGATFFLEGSGEVVADLDRITLRALSPGRVVLRYHWHPAFRAEPPVAIAPYVVADAAQPFIEVRNGRLRDVTLRIH